MYVNQFVVGRFFVISMVGERERKRSDFFLNQFLFYLPSCQQ
jgi:hypothetical protein